MRSPLDHIGRRPKRSPFGSDLHIYKPPRPARSLRGKLILAAVMCVATLATGLFIHARLSQKPVVVAAEPANPVAHTESAVAKTEAPASVETASLVKPTVVRTVSMPAEPSTAPDGVEPGTLGHNDPRWGRANQKAGAETADAVAANPEARVQPSSPEEIPAKAAAQATPDEPSLAYATDDDSSAKRKADNEFTAAIAPDARAVQPAEMEEDIADTPPGVARTVRIAKAVNLRANPRSGSRVLRVLPAGANVGLVSCNGWCEVTYEGSRGFIYKSFVQGGGSAKARSSVPRVQTVVQRRVNSLFRQVTQR